MDKPGGGILNCKICGARDCDCEEAIRAQVLRIAERFGRIRKAIALMDSKDLMKREVKSGAQMGQSRQPVSQ